MYQNPYLLELEAQERQRTFQREVAYLQLAAAAPREPLRQRLAAVLIALAARVAPSLEVTVRPRGGLTTGRVR